MDIKEFSEKLAEATKELGVDEREALLKMFSSVTQEIEEEEASEVGS